MRETCRVLFNLFNRSHPHTHIKYMGKLYTLPPQVLFHQKKKLFKNFIQQGYGDIRILDMAAGAILTTVLSGQNLNRDKLKSADH